MRAILSPYVPRCQTPDCPDVARYVLWHRGQCYGPFCLLCANRKANRLDGELTQTPASPPYR